MQTLEKPVRAAEELVDDLGRLRAKIAELQDAAKRLEALLVASGSDAIEGRLYRAAISRVEGRATVNWQAVAKHFGPSHQLVTAHTTIGAPYVVVRVSARSKAPR